MAVIDTMIRAFPQLGGAMLLMALANPTAGSAQEATKPFAELARCRGLAVDSERLACLDRASDALLTAEQKREIVILTAGDVERTRQSMFGYSIPDLKAFGAVANRSAPPIQHFTGRITRVRQVSYGKYDMVMDSGAIWRNSDLLSDTPTVGAEIKIDRSIAGGYLLKVPFEASVHAVRVQ